MQNCDEILKAIAYFHGMSKTMFLNQCSEIDKLNKLQFITCQISSFNWKSADVTSQLRIPDEVV